MKMEQDLYSNTMFGLKFQKPKLELTRKHTGSLSFLSPLSPRLVAQDYRQNIAFNCRQYHTNTNTIINQMSLSSPKIMLVEYFSPPILSFLWNIRAISYFIPMGHIIENKQLCIKTQPRKYFFQFLLCFSLIPAVPNLQPVIPSCKTPIPEPRSVSTDVSRCITKIWKSVS